MVKKSKTNLDLIETNDLSAKAAGGTELMLRRIYDGKIPRDLLQKFQIIPTRVRELQEDKFRILFINDLPGDPEVQHLANQGWHKFHRIVFVSNWQAQHFIEMYDIPWSKCVVMLNAIDPITENRTNVLDNEINLIYHTTPHRGLNILLPVFEKLCEKYDNLHLDVYSSFKLYGWEQRDEQFRELYDFMDAHPKITSHGAVPNAEVRQALANSDIFAYPSVWPETSCLCLMEAMSSALNCVHPNYGALFETASQWTTMYNFHEDPQDHAKLFYMMLCNAIDNVHNENLQGRLASQKVFADAFYNWSSRAKQWEALLTNVAQSGETVEVTQPEKEFKYSVG